MNKKKSKFPYLIGLSALLVAFASAFFSVFGLSQLFAGAKVQVIFMAGSLELAKLVLASFLYRYWINVNKAMRSYMLIAVAVLMLITSGGIYGYLSSAYQETATKYQTRDIQKNTLIQKKQLDSLDVVRLQTSLNSEYDSKNRSQTNIDTLYNRRQNTTAKRIEERIAISDTKITTLQSQIDEKNNSISDINTKILDLETLNISGEIGPLKYISDLTGYPMDKIVNIFILLLIFVFDPLAVTMIVGANVAFKQNENITPEKEIEQEEPISKMWSWLKRKPKKESKMDLKELETILDNKLENETKESLSKFVEEQKEKEEIAEKEESMIDYEKIKKDVQESLEPETPETLNKFIEDINNEPEIVDERPEIINSGSVDVHQEFLNSIDTYGNETQKQALIELADSLKKEDEKLNIYGENLEEIPNDTQTESHYSSIIQSPPPSAYTPGGGIKVT